MLLSLLLLVSVLAGLSVFLASQERTLHRIVLTGSTLVGILALFVGISALPTTPHLFGGGWWYVDPFAALLIILIGFIQWTATLTSIPYLHEEMHEGVVTWAQARMYYLLLQLFVFSMLLTVISNNIGLMWVALEGTTLATTLLVAFYTREGSLEAAWKYILICSVGITLGILGLLLVVYASQQGGLSIGHALTWTALGAAASTFPPALMRWAFVFIFIGYGAKVGLVPMHTWLPDAHGRTPSPISAMLSGVLLNVALFAILRYKSLVDASLGSAVWTQRFFLFFGALSFLLPIAFVIIQRNYKRLLAYSSIEHMGLIVFAIGLGAPGMIAAVIHIVGHALAKSLLFFGTGNILLRWKSTKIEHVGAVMQVLPRTGTLFLLGVLALLALPPSPLFLSEYLIVSAAFAHHPVLILVLLLGGVLIFGGMINLLMPLLYTKREGVESPVSSEPWNLSHTAMTLHVLALIGVGVFCLTPFARTLIADMVSYLL